MKCILQCQDSNPSAMGVDEFNVNLKLVGPFYNFAMTYVGMERRSRT